MSIPYERSFASSEKSKFWSDKNGDVKPEEVFKSSHKKYWFDCNRCIHTFDIALNEIKRGGWCPYCCIPSKKFCDNEKCKLCLDKSFASNEKSKFWSYKNGDIKPKDVFNSSHKKYWFDCDNCNHSFYISLSNVNINRWCSYCSNQKLCDDENCKSCFDKSFASCEKKIYWSDDKNSDVKPRDVFKKSEKKYWFGCQNCNHSFNTQLDVVSRGGWCSFCSNNQLCNDTNCKSCFDKSFASSEKNVYWSIKNKDVKPRDVFNASSKTKYWFDCVNCNHSFDTLLNNVKNGFWCPYCCVPSKKFCNDEKCKLCLDKSFESNEKSKFWSDKNGDIKPKDVFNSSHKKYWFDCDNCNHSFYISLSHLNEGKWCSFCSHGRLCDDENCKFCFDKSFASSEKSIYWNNKNGDVKPRDVFKSSGNKYWFDCNKCNNIFDTTLGNVTNGCWCPYCVNKTEAILYERLLSVYPTIQIQFKQDWCKRTNHLPFDFCITEHKIIIELDGPQHFKQVSNWDSPENQLENDLFKEKCANDNDYSVIRIIQEDVFYNRYDWFKELCDVIADIVNGDDIVNVYICKNGEYDKF